MEVLNVVMALFALVAYIWLLVWNLRLCAERGRLKRRIDELEWQNHYSLNIRTTPIELLEASQRVYEKKESK